LTVQAPSSPEVRQSISLEKSNLLMRPSGSETSLSSLGTAHKNQKKSLCWAGKAGRCHDVKVVSCIFIFDSTQNSIRHLMGSGHSILLAQRLKHDSAHPVPGLHVRLLEQTWGKIEIVTRCTLFSQSRNKPAGPTY
ncbi:hypothetical protein MCOR23_010489, partial [Pyricularia oryzae]